MQSNSNTKSSRKAKILPQFSIPSRNKPLLDLLEIQRKSFFDLLEHGIPYELAKTSIFRETTNNSTFTQELELKFNPETYKFVSPNCTPKQAILNGKTYACKIYVQATLVIRSPNQTHEITLNNEKFVKTSKSKLYQRGTNANFSDVPVKTRVPRFLMRKTFGKFSYDGALRLPTIVSTMKPMTFPILSTLLFVRSKTLTSYTQDGKRVNPSISSHASIHRKFAFFSSCRKASVPFYGRAATDAKQIFDLHTMPLTSSMSEGAPLLHTPKGVCMVCNKGVSTNRKHTKQKEENLRIYEGDKRAHLTGAKQDTDVQIFRPWIFLGELPLMTKRGHFILNGSPRVIVNQIARCPGIYFQEKRRGVGFEQEIRVSADLIPQRGPWLRVQSDWEGRFWARLKQEGRVKYATLYEAFQEYEKEYNAPLVCLLSNNSSTFSKSETVSFQERKTKEDRQKKALIRLFKNTSRYSLGKLGRFRVNERVHSYASLPLSESIRLRQKFSFSDLDPFLKDSFKNLPSNISYPTVASYPSSPKASVPCSFGSATLTSKICFAPKHLHQRFASVAGPKAYPFRGSFGCASTRDTQIFDGNFSSERLTSSTCSAFFGHGATTKDAMHKEKITFLFRDPSSFRVYFKKNTRKLNTLFAYKYAQDFHLNSFKGCHKNMNVGFYTPYRDRTVAIFSPTHRCLTFFSPRAYPYFLKEKFYKGVATHAWNPLLMGTLFCYLFPLWKIPYGSPLVASPLVFFFQKSNIEDLHTPKGVSTTNLRTERIGRLLQLGAYPLSESFARKTAFPPQEDIEDLHTPKGICKSSMSTKGKYPICSDPTKNGREATVERKKIGGDKQEKSNLIEYTGGKVWERCVNGIRKKDNPGKNTKKFIEKSLAKLNRSQYSHTLQNKIPLGKIKKGKTSVFEDSNQNYLLMAKDIDAIHTCLERLLEGQGFTDDIDHLKNRFIRTSGKLLQQQFELGLHRLNEVIMPLLGNLLHGHLESFQVLKEGKRKKKNSTIPLVPPLHPKRVSFFPFEGKDCHQRFSSFPSYPKTSYAYSFRGSFGRKDTQIYTSSSDKMSDVVPIRLLMAVAPRPGQLLVLTPLGVCKSSMSSYGRKAVLRAKLSGCASTRKTSKICFRLTSKICFASEGTEANLRRQSKGTKSFGLRKHKEDIFDFSSKEAMPLVDLQTPLAKQEVITTSLPKEKIGEWEGNNGNFEMESGILAEIAPFRWLRTSKPINSAFREFFGSNPLSQYMDQTNPLAEITHKRRLSSMGPGGIKRETAGMEVRGIHPTHYGRVCPIETPEGKNAGLVNSPTVYGRVGNYGFLETPLYQVIENQVQMKRWAFFSAQQEENEKSSLATCDTGLLKFNILNHVPIPVQTANNPLAHFQQVERNRVGYRALSPVQAISIATALIPFLEHDDANRALMGSNMQRQAIPLLLPERPIVGTGFEPLVMVESGQALQATKLGCVSRVNANTIIVHTIHSMGKAISQNSLRNTIDNNSMGLRSKTVKFGSTPIQFTPCFFRLPVVALVGAYPFLSFLSFLSVSFLLVLTPFGVCKSKICFASLPSEGTKANLRFAYSERSKHQRRTRSTGRIRGLLVRRSTSFGRQGREQDMVEVRSERTLHLCSSHKTFLLQPIKQDLQLYQRSNQETCLNQRPIVKEGDWIQKGDFLADSSASDLGDLALGKNVLVAYMPWEGYNFEDAIVISDRLVSDDIYTSLHIERYEIKINKNSQGKERITNRVPGTFHSLKHLDNFGIARISSWVQPGDILVGKVVELKRPLSPYERLAWELASRLSPASPEREKWLNKVWLEDISLRLPSGVSGRVINSQIVSTEWSEKEQVAYPQEVHIYLAVKRKIQIGDKLAGRHGNKGIVSAILPQQDMPYVGDGSSIDMVLNPLGVPSRMNVGQIFECLLGLAGSQLGCNFKITPFDEIAGGEASRSLVFLKLYQCRLMYKQQWLFTPTFPGKSKLFDGRTGEPFENWVTVGQAYMLKLIHMVDHKIHARSTGPYSLFTRQPVRGRSRRGGQRLGEMEVWAVEGFGAAYTLQEFLTIKSDDLKARTALQKGFYKQNDVTFGKIHISPGNPEAFKVLVSELQALCLDIQM